MLIIELATIMALQLLMVVMVVTSTVVLFTLAYRSLSAQAGHIDTVEQLLFVVQRSLAGI